MAYGTEGWTLKAKQIKKIQSTEMWFYRRMLRVSWREERTDESILKELGTKRELVNCIKKRKLSFIGHACRSKMFPHERHNARKSRRKKKKGKTSNAIHR